LHTHFLLHLANHLNILI